MKAMEYTEIDSADVERYIEDERYHLEQKMDGTRVLIQLGRDGNHTYLTRKGEPLKHTAALKVLPGIQSDLDKIASKAQETGLYPLLLDGELIPETGEYHIFDVPSKPYPYRMRREIIGRVVPFGLKKVKVVRTYTDAESKRELWNRVQVEGAEGIMIKPSDAAYSFGERSKECLKAKLVKTADVIVLAVHRPDPKHGTITFGVYDPEMGNVRVGSCSAIGKPPVTMGDVIEIRYLYWTGTTPYQPRMVRVRDDKAADDCRMDQFKTYSRKAV